MLDAVDVIDYCCFRTNQLLRWRTLPLDRDLCAKHQSQRVRQHFEILNISHPLGVVPLLRLVLGGHNRGPAKELAESEIGAPLFLLRLAFLRLGFGLEVGIVFGIG